MLKGSRIISGGREQPSQGLRSIVHSPTSASAAENALPSVETTRRSAGIVATRRAEKQKARQASGLAAALLCWGVYVALWASHAKDGRFIIPFGAHQAPDLLTTQ